MVNGDKYENLEEYISDTLENMEWLTSVWKMLLVDLASLKRKMELNTSNGNVLKNIFVASQIPHLWGKDLNTSPKASFTAFA